MEFIKFLLLLAIHLYYFNIVNGQELCPKACECDSFENLNRANCRRQKLISAAIEISEYVQILDLDENEITVLNNDCFRKQIHIRKLSVAYNSIHTIYLNAFSTLAKLQTIDLSYNRLEYFDNKIFENNYQLIEVNLSGNKFMSFPNQPLFISSSVRSLFLENSQITHIYPTLFSKIPSLEHLDLSENLMITITTEPFNQLDKLIEVNLENNRWICDKNIENVIKLLKSKVIKVELNMCHFELKKGGNGNGMFEKIMVESNLNTNKEEKPETIIESVWKSLSSSENELEACFESNNILYVCNMYTKCLQNLTIITKAFENFKNESKAINHHNNEQNFFTLINDTQLSFYLGVCIGAALVFVMVTCTLCVTKCCKPKHKKKNLAINDIVSANEEFQYLNLDNRPQISNINNSIIPLSPPPIQIRNSRRRSRRRPPPPPPLNRSVSTPDRRMPLETVNDFASFITRLFERPSRHRYYRALNQNTQNLIRRLSRTSLVNNRLSQHFLNETMRNRYDRNNSNNSNGYAENIRREDEVRPNEMDPNETNDITQEFELFVPNSNENDATDNTTNFNQEYIEPTSPRSETPPPSYTEVVKH